MSTRLIAYFALAFLLSHTSFAGPTAQNVLVLYNSASTESAEIASYYAQKRPGVRTLGLTGIPAGEEITVDQYRNIIRPQVQGALDSSVDVIVTTKGLPLRIYNDHSVASFPHNYTDPQGVQRTIYSDTYKRYSSLESELTRIDNFSTWKQMGDQTWWYPPTGFHPSHNPYSGSSAFSHSDPANEGMRLSSRLDGYTVADVKAVIDRAQKVFVVPRGHMFLVDDSPSAMAQNTSMAELVNSVLAPRQQLHQYDTSTNPVLSVAQPVMGYVGHGTNDGSGQLGPRYLLDQLNLSLAAGAVFHTWESFNAHSFIEGSNQGQALIGDWLRRGGTGAIGHVQEPGGNLSNVTSEETLFRMLLDGYTFVEAAWGATPQLSYVNTVIGDPLMKWQAWLPGDANLDGMVNLNDYARLQANWLQSGTFAKGDFNGDGLINLNDYSILQINWLRTADGDTAQGPGLPTMPVPEPATGLGMLCFTLLLRRGKRALNGLQ